MKTMKKLSLLIALALCITIGGVYATWTYIQNENVLSVTQAGVINLTEATSAGNYGTYKVDVTKAAMMVDPKDGTSHITSLVVGGDITLTFIPNVNAPQDIKNNAVASTYQLSMTNATWTPEGQSATNIIAQLDTELHTITWVSDGNGGFTYTIPAATLLSYINLTEFTLDTMELYTSYQTALANVRISITVADAASGT